MRNIEEIFDELRQHPDFLTAEIFIKSDVVNYIIDTIDDEELYRPSVEKWVKQNSHMIIGNINDVVCNGYEYGSPFDETVESFRKQFLVVSE